MAEAITVARPYALAAWRHAAAESKADLWSEMLDFMAAVVADKTMAKSLLTPG